MSAFNKSCESCEKRKLVLNKYDDFVNECIAADNRRINCNIFEEHPDWCPLQVDEEVE